MTDDKNTDEIEALILEALRREDPTAFIQEGPDDCWSIDGCFNLHRAVRHVLKAVEGHFD